MNVSDINIYTEAILNGPALRPPLGVTPNFSQPNSISKYSLPIMIFGLVLVTSAVSTRLYTRRFLIHNIGWEDYFIVIGLGLLFGYCVPNIKARNDAGGHQWNYTMRSFLDLLFYSYVGEVLYAPTILFVKLSILLQYIRILVPFRELSRSMYTWIHVVLWANVAFYTADMFVELFSCTPRSFAWNKLLPHGHCVDVNALIVSAAAINVGSDFVILLLPMFRIWKLQTSRRKKVRLTALFGTGLCACVASTMRLYYSVLLASSDDMTRNIALASYWSFSEIAIGIICCCLPTIPRFVQFVVPKISETWKGGGSSRTTGTPWGLYTVATRKTSNSGTREEGVVILPGFSREFNTEYQDPEIWQGSRDFCMTGFDGKRSRTDPDLDVESGQIVRTFSVAVTKYPHDHVDI